MRPVTQTGSPASLREREASLTRSRAPGIRRGPGRLAWRGVGLLALWVAGASWVGLLGGCERDMLTAICPEVAPGQLVVSEIRGPQDGVDTYGQWIEIYNSGEAGVDLAGLKMRITRLDGSGEHSFMIRADSLPLAAHDYFVMGRFPPDAPPVHVDYGYGDEVSSDLYADGILELVVCGDVMDRVIYHDLPTVGTLSLDGSQVPSVEANDDESNFCTDDADVGTDPTEVGIPGTPGEPNRPCL